MEPAARELPPGPGDPMKNINAQIQDLAAAVANVEPIYPAGIRPDRRGVEVSGAAHGYGCCGEECGACRGIEEAHRAAYGAASAPAAQLEGAPHWRDPPIDRDRLTRVYERLRGGSQRKVDR